MSSHDDNWGHFVVLSHRIVEEDEADGSFIDRHSLRHTKYLDIDIVPIDDGCRYTILVFYVLTELVRFPWSDHGELVKWRHGIRIETIDLRNPMSCDAVEVSASSKESGDSSKDHREKYSPSSGLHDRYFHLTWM